MLKASQSFFVSRIQSKEKKFTEKELFKEKREWRIEQKQKESFLTALATAIKKEPTASIRKHANELKVSEKTVRTAIKQDLNQDFNPVNYAIWGVLENKTNATPIQILVRLRLLLRRNEMKCLKNLFWTYANRFEGLLIE